MLKVLEEFKKLLEVNEKLMGPGGCPWDREQTLVSMRGSIVEEVYEVIDAIDENDIAHLVEELGDLFYNVLFFCTLGEKEKKFATDEVLQVIRLKLIERHPHVFGDKKVENSEAVLEQWEKIKHEKRESLMDGIPKALPALARGYKMAGKMKRNGYLKVKESASFNNEEELGQLLWQIVIEAKEKGLNPEQALRDLLFREEKRFRQHEKGENSSKL